MAMDGLAEVVEGSLLTFPEPIDAMTGPVSVFAQMMGPFNQGDTGSSNAVISAPVQSIGPIVAGMPDTYNMWNQPA